MASLEGICAPTRADSDAPAGLTSLHRQAHHRLWLRAGEGAGLLKHLLREMIDTIPRQGMGGSGRYRSFPSFMFLLFSGSAGLAWGTMAAAGLRGHWALR
jgi:hypothetical protein